MSHCAVPAASSPPRVYRAVSPLRQPAQLVRDIVRDLQASRELAWRLFVRNISARYRQTLLGYFWAVFPPLATTAIWLILTRQRVVQIELGGADYAVFLVTGTILWQSFADAVQIPVRVIGESKSMLAKVNFPRESLLLVAAAECYFNTCIRCIILVIAFTVQGFAPAATVPLAFMGLTAIILLGLAIGLIISPFALLYDDVNNGLVLFLQIWMYLTPVIYPMHHGGFLGALNVFNPVSPLLVQTREWILTGHNEMLGASGLVAGVTLASLFAGFVLYRVALPRTIERLSS